MSGDLDVEISGHSTGRSTYRFCSRGGGRRDSTTWMVDRTRLINGRTEEPGGV